MWMRSSSSRVPFSRVVSLELGCEFAYAANEFADTNTRGVIPVKYRLPRDAPVVRGEKSRRDISENDVIVRDRCAGGNVVDLQALGAGGLCHWCDSALGDAITDFAAEHSSLSNCWSECPIICGGLHSECPLCVCGLPLEIVGTS